MKPTESIAKAKEILNKYDIGESLCGSDFKIIISILIQHPEAGDKIGCGVARFDVVREEVYGHRRFEIVRTDGTRQDFSYIKCIQKNNLHHKDVIKAFRWEVLPQIRDFKSSSYGKKIYVRCAITNLNVRQQDCHIDHCPPLTFDTLVFNFLSTQSLSIGSIEVEDVGDVFIVRLRDRLLASLWQEYHSSIAVLRVTLNKANLGQRKVFVDWSKLRVGASVECENKELVPALEK